MLGKGSPPQVRGKQGGFMPTIHINGITPAGAGKTDLQAMRFRKHEDHPRRCGENQAFPLFLACLLGSPPQVRGKLVFCHGRLCAAGITPAGAGKTSRCRNISMFLKDHPRRCGENSLRKTGLQRRGGSPPQVRGKQCAALTRFNCFRITPAGAGKTILYCPSFKSVWDHPRRCGENFICTFTFAILPGSPPQVRGKPFVPS